MQAELTGDRFEITRIGSAIQELSPTDFQEWQWNVTPTKSGNRTLFLVVSILREDNNRTIKESALVRPIVVACNCEVSGSNRLIARSTSSGNVG
ncbi:MAG: hypothetical protein ACRDZO_19275 [Egibacteraceae bacterium]